VHLGTAELIGRVSLLDRDELEPGEETGIQILLEQPVAVWPGDRYVIRSYSPVSTIGGGTVLGNLSPRKRKRLAEADRQYNREVFQILRQGGLEDKTLLFLKESGAKGLTFDDLAIRLGLFGKHLKKVLEPPLSTRRIVVVDSASQRYLAADVADAVRQTLVDNLTAYHRDNPLQAGLSKEELRSGLGRRVDLKVFSFCLNDLLRKETVVQEESLVRLAGHQVALKADEEELQREINSWYREKGLFTPTLKETMEHFANYPENQVKQVVDLQLREGKLVKISESLYFSKETIDGLIAAIQDYISREGEIDAPGFKNLTGLTRKFSIPILEYFDRIKLTIRIGDKRILRKKS
jgi:selenocysteine-specific elongation factor